MNKAIAVSVIVLMAFPLFAAPRIRISPTVKGSFVRPQFYIKGALSATGTIYNGNTYEFYPAEENPITGEWEKVDGAEAVETDSTQTANYKTTPFNYSVFFEMAPVQFYGFAFLSIGTGYISNPRTETQNVNELGNSQTWGFASVPVYTFLKVNIPVDKITYPYLIGKAGVNFPLKMDNTDVENVELGCFFAGGLGMDVSNLQFELLYAMSTVNIKTSSEHRTYTTTDSSGTRVEADGLLIGGNEYQYHQIILCMGVKF